MAQQNDSRVAVQIMGGLGNQMFQYATGRALAQRLGARLTLDCTPRMANPRTFMLDRFPIEAGIIRNAPVEIRPRRFQLRGSLGRWITHSVHDVFARTEEIDGHRFKIAYEKRAFAYDPRVQSLAGSIYLIGWWQSYRYFDCVAGIIRSELRSPTQPRPSNQAWLERIRQTDSVCLHVRRGDYLDPASVAYFGVCLPSYYTNAVRFIRERVERPAFFVFSDDLAWCRANLPGEDMTFVDANTPDDAADELALMAACRHHIIANSSFSWCAAWLAHHPAQAVVAPDPWFKGERSTPDLLPPSWVRMPAF
jgi:hypothetical protein